MNKPLTEGKTRGQIKPKGSNPLPSGTKPPPPPNPNNRWLYAITDNELKAVLESITQTIREIEECDEIRDPNGKQYHDELVSAHTKLGKGS